MKVKKSIVIARVDNTLKLVIVGEETSAEFIEDTAVATLMKAYAFIYKLICKELYIDEIFKCDLCKLQQGMGNFAGIMVDNKGRFVNMCIKCDSEMNKTSEPN